MINSIAFSPCCSYIDITVTGEWYNLDSPANDIGQVCNRDGKFTAHGFTTPVFDVEDCSCSDSVYRYKLSWLNDEYSNRVKEYFINNSHKENFYDDIIEFMSCNNKLLAIIMYLPDDFYTEQEMQEIKEYQAEFADFNED